MTDTLHPDLRIHSYGHYLRTRFALRVSKVNVDAGFTCPNRDGTKGTGGCIYCDNSSFSPPGTQPVRPLEEQLAEGIAYHRRRLGSERFIVYFQKFTNTYGPVERLEELYRSALAYPDVVGISVGTRPDSLTDDALDLLQELSRDRYVCVELGLQSMDDAILLRINRGHSFDDYLDAAARVKARSLQLCTHLIYGFPGESGERFAEGAQLMNRLGVDSVKLHQLHAVKGTRLAEMFRSGDYVPLTHREYVATACDFLERLSPRVTVQRLYGSAPLAIRVAPQWGLKNNAMWYSVINELKRRGSFQGSALPGEVA